MSNVWPMRNFTNSKSLLFLLFFSLGSMVTYAQLSYSFTQTSTTYTEITGGTVIGINGDDDIVYINGTTGTTNTSESGTGFPIGFNFNYNGQTFTSVAISSNGYLKLGSGTFSIYNTLSGPLIEAGDPGNVGLDNTIMPFSEDLVYGNSPATIRYMTQGTAPNRTFTVQWKGFSLYPLNVSENINFQVRLYETTNAVEIKYGTVTMSASNIGFGSVGLRGTGQASFSNRAALSGLNTWATSVAGISNFDGSDLFLGFTPASGLTYTWTPTATEPTAQPTAFASSSITSTSFTVSYTAAAGPPAGYIAVRRVGSAPTTDPVDGTAYTAGATLGDGIVAFSGNATSFAQSGLTAGTQYFYKIYAYNGSGASINYRVTTPLTGNVITSGTVSEPTAQPTVFASSSITGNSFTVSYTAATGTPAGYIAVRKVGSAPTTDPVDATAYTVGSTLGDGTIAFVGSAVTFNETGLTAGTNYFYKIYSYNGSGATINYRQTTPLQGNVTTTALATEPTAQPTAFASSSITTTSFTISYTAAAGPPAGYIAVRKIGSAPTTDPQDGTAYSVGATLGDGVIAFVGNAVTFSQTGLASGTQYFYKIYSYNGSASTINYRITTPLQGNATTTSTLATEPTAQPSSFASASVTSSSFTVSYTAAAGPPAGYIAVRKIGSAPTTDPQDGLVYTLGGPLGDGIIAYVGAAATFNETGLAASTQYFYKIYSYNGSSTTTNYRQTTPLQGSVTTTAPPAATVNLAFKEVSNSFSSNFFGVRFVSSLTAIAVGGSGLAVKTINGGTSWTTLSIPSAVTLWNIAFSNTTTAYIVGDAGLILKSTNTGTSWTAQTSGSANDLYTISFPSLNVGYVGGAAGTILKTTNGGTSWTPLNTGVTGSYFNSIVFFDDLTGIAAGNGGVIRTTDGGATWTSVNALQILWLSFPTNLIGYGVGASGTVIKTTNGGVSWTSLTSNTSENLWGAHFTSTDIGFAVGDNATIIKTSNGGTTWTDATTDVSSVGINAVHFGTVDAGLAVGESGTILITEAELPAIAITSVNAKNEIPAKGGTTVSITIPTADVPRVDEVTVYVYDIQDVANDIYTNGVPLPTTVSGGTFTATFNDLQSDPIGYYYFFEIAYEGYLRYTYSDPYYAYLKYENTNTLKLPALKSGSSANDYQIISVPLQLTNAQISTVFDELMPADKAKWRIFTYQSGTTVEQAVSGQVTPGKGYWLISTSSPTIDLGAGKTVAANGESPFTMNLSSGWNLIGNPYNFNVTWNAGTAVRELKQFNNGSYSTASSMSPFVGYYVFANTAGSYPIPVTGTFSGGRKRTSRFDQSEIAWELPITLQRGDLKNELGGIGIHAEASEGFDELDEPALPIPVSQNMFAMLFDRTDLPYSLNKEVVPVTESHRWNFTINQPEGTESVEMKWDPALLIHLSKRLYLYDEAKLELVDMMTRSNHFTQANASLSILYGDENFIRQSTLGKDSRVAQPYPNPAREQLSIPVMMAETGTVTVTIKDSFGRSVQSFSNQVERGHHQLTLTDMRDIPAGMYFVSTEILTGTTRYIKTHKILINQTSR